MASRPDLKVNTAVFCSRPLANPSQLDDEKGFISWFNRLEPKDEDTIRVFSRGDWYSAHGDDATVIARNVR